MIFEYGETNRISGFTLSVCVPPSARPTYSFVLDWEKRKEPKVSLSDKEETSNVKHLSSECTIKDSNSLSSTGSILFTKSSIAKKSEKFGGNVAQNEEIYSKHSDFEQMMEKQKEFADTRNQTYDNLESYKRSAQNDSMQIKNLCNEEKSNCMIKVKIILRYYKHNEITESIITDKVINSSTLIDALKFSLRNTSIPTIGNNYGRLFIFPNDKRSGKVRELPYEQNRHELLKEFCNCANRCTLLLDLTHTFLNQMEYNK